MLKSLGDGQRHSVVYRRSRATRPVRPDEDGDRIGLTTWVSDKRYLIEHTPKESTALGLKSPAFEDRLSETPSHLLGHDAAKRRARSRTGGSASPHGSEQPGRIPRRCPRCPQRIERSTSVDALRVGRHGLGLWSHLTVLRCHEFGVVPMAHVGRHAIQHGLETLDDDRLSTSDGARGGH